MKYLLVPVLVAAMLVAAGCTGGTREPVAAPATSLPVAPTAGTVHGTVTVTATTPAPVVTATAPAGDSRFRSYRDSEFGFVFEIPRCWTASGDYVIAPGTGRKYVVVFEDPAMTSSQSITVTPDSAGLSLDDWENVFVTQVKNDPAVTVAGQFTQQVDGTPAKKLILTYGSGEYATQSAIVMAVKGSNAYFMEFTSRQNDFSRYSDDVDRMIATFAFP